MLVKMTVHEIAKDGLPSDDILDRVAFLFDGCIVSGWPLKHLDYGDLGCPWVTDSYVGKAAKFVGVTHWVEFETTFYQFGPRAGISGEDFDELSADD